MNVLRIRNTVTFGENADASPVMPINRAPANPTGFLPILSAIIPAAKAPMSSPMKTVVMML